MFRTKVWAGPIPSEGSLPCSENELQASLPCRRPLLPVSLHTVFPLRVSGSVAKISPFYKGINHGLEPTLRTSYELDYSLLLQ